MDINRLKTAVVNEMLFFGEFQDTLAVFGKGVDKPAVFKNTPNNMKNVSVTYEIKDGKAEKIAEEKTPQRSITEWAYIMGHFAYGLAKLSLKAALQNIQVVALVSPVSLADGVEGLVLIYHDFIQSETQTVLYEICYPTPDNMDLLEIDVVDPLTIPEPLVAMQRFLEGYLDAQKPD